MSELNDAADVERNTASDQNVEDTHDNADADLSDLAAESQPDQDLVEGSREDTAAEHLPELKLDDTRSESGDRQADELAPDERIKEHLDSLVARRAEPENPENVKYKGDKVSEIKYEDGKSAKFGYNKDGELTEVVTDAVPRFGDKPVRFFRKDANSPWQYKSSNGYTYEARIDMELDGTDLTYKKTWGQDRKLHVLTADGHDLTGGENAGGTQVVTDGTKTVIKKPDSTTKIEKQGDGPDAGVNEITRLDGEGKEAFSLKRVPGKDGKPDTWIAADGSKLPEQLNESTDGKTFKFTGTVEVDRDGNVIFHKEVKHENGNTTTLGMDENGEARSYSRSDGNQTTTWKRQGDTDWWSSDKGEAEQRKVEFDGNRVIVSNQDGTQEQQADGSWRQSQEGKERFDDKDEQKDSLDELARKRFEELYPDPEKSRTHLEQFKKNMEAFEKTAKEQGHSDEEISRTYREISRMLATSGNSPFDSKQRTQIAEQAMSQLADPTRIGQGGHNTCNVATLETKLYRSHPSATMGILADVATTGKFQTHDGSTIEIDANSLKPDREALMHNAASPDSRNHPADRGKRSFASQLFQVAAVNAHWQRRNSSELVEGCYKFRYQQNHPRTVGVDAREDTGERLMIDQGDGYKPFQPFKMSYDQTQDSAARLGMLTRLGTDLYKELNSPNLDERGLTDIYKQITGEKPDSLILTSKETRKSGVDVIESKEELGESLEELKEHGKLPVIVRVHTGQEPFATECGITARRDAARRKAGETTGGAGGPEGGWHVVTITDVNRGPDGKLKISVDNQWPTRMDHVKPGTRLDLDTMWKAMHKPEPEAKLKSRRK